MKLSALLLASAVLVVAAASGAFAGDAATVVSKIPGLGAPLHASCKATFVVSATCDVVGQALVQAIQGMSGTDCGSGEKCRYTLDSSTATLIKAHHETPTKHYVDHFSFTLTETGATTCSVAGSSSSDTWYAVLDHGTNFCNMYNVFRATTYTPQITTSNKICTQYSSYGNDANCDKY